MARYVAVRDRRLEGGVPKRDGLSIINTSANTTLSSLFGQVRSALGPRERFEAMFILCHGYAGRNLRAAVSMDAGGEGLQLCAEDVLHSNVSRWTAIAGKVNHIIVYSCAAANTERGNEGSTADGRYLMGALAIYTEANVYAADRIQWYDTHGGLKNGRFEFGDWEGNLWRFPPSGQSPTVVPRAPVEFADVMAGTAP